MIRCIRCGAEGWTVNDCPKCKAKPPVRRTEAVPEAPAQVAAKVVEKHTKGYAPPGQCVYCDYRRQYAKVAMKKLYDKRRK